MIRSKASEKSPPEIESTPVAFVSREGRKIVGFFDGPEGGPPVVLTPKFGESKKNNLQMAYHLAANGMRVLRFDHTDHVGESDGEIEQYTLTGAVIDIHSALDHLEQKWGIQSVQLVANSLSARCAIRVAAIDGRVSRLVTMVGVVNFQRTATVVYQRDMVADYRAGRMQGISDILGHQVDVDNFLRDCLANDLQDLEGTLRDVREAACDLFFFNADRDVWVDFEEVRALEACNPRVRIATLEGGMHELRENPGVAAEAAKALVHVCKTGNIPDPANAEAETIQDPPKKALVAQNKLERERLRAAAPLRESENAFWDAYLRKYDVLENVGDYAEYMQLIGNLLGEIEPKKVYFDCGCGNGLYGAWCLRDWIRRSPGLDPPPVYFGLDLTAKGLMDAARRHRGAQSLSGSEGSTPDFIYLRYDLDAIDLEEEPGVGLPFGDASVDRVCCSLLVSYLKRPEFLLRELRRVMKPGGRIVVTSMKPHCDLSAIYKDVVDEARDRALLDSARDLLSAAGAIRLKEEEGHYKFYDRSELADLVRWTGFRETASYRSFGDQANLVSATK